MPSFHSMKSNDNTFTKPRKRQEVREEAHGVAAMIMPNVDSNDSLPQKSVIGPDPIQLSQMEVDELYGILSVVISLLDDLEIQYVVIKGSLLGAVSTQSILFCEQNVDIAIIDDGKDPYTRFLKILPKVLNSASTQRSDATDKFMTYDYHQQSREGCDRIMSSDAPNVWVHVFVLKKYDSTEELVCLLDVNVQDADADARLGDVKNFLTEKFPLYHYDNRNAIELWPHQYFSPSELFPLQRLKFGPLEVFTPHETSHTLQRVYDNDLFIQYHCRIDECVPNSRTNWSRIDTRSLHERGSYLIEHSNPDKWAIDSRIYQHSKIGGYDCEPDLESCSDGDDEQSPPRVSSPSIGGSMGMTRSKSLFSIRASTIDHFLSPPSLASSLTTIHDWDGYPQELGPSKWYGADLRRCLGDDPKAPDFENGVRKAMEPHLQTARRDRQNIRKPSHLQIDASIPSYVGIPYTSLRDERRFLFDEHSYPIHEVLSQTLGIADLSLLHEHPVQDMVHILAPLLSRDGRRRFHASYDSFVTGFCIPLLHSIAMEKGLFHTKTSNTPSKVYYRYQAFPCLSIVRPGEFSIGPHCDTAHGHSMGNLNFHIPLTPAFGTNALFTESNPGREDWHPLSTKSVGLGYLFDGARCLHFTLENTTDATRVSLDFRIAIYRDESPMGHIDKVFCSKNSLEDAFSLAGPGYYDEASIDVSVGSSSFPGSMVAQKYSRHLLDPDSRVGLPFKIKPAG